MLNIVICDDSQIDINNLLCCITEAEKKLNTNFIITVYTDADAFIKESPKKKIDLLFLDIYIKNKNGIDIAKEFRRHDTIAKIVFFTSSDDFAVQSYSVSAFNYILKPAKAEIITEIIKECIEICKREKGKFILIKQRNSVFPVPFNNILFIESRGRQLFVHTTSHGIVSYYQKLDELQQTLDEKCFLRCHQSYLVNMDYVHSVEDNFFKMINGQEVFIRKIGMQDTKNTFFSYISQEL